ncbi:MAG: hypothetical protein CMJ32_09950 [Phycisphaerae bacterium]|nr:hypothetical protein [Phycisphaerae bacterium]
MTFTRVDLMDWFTEKRSTLGMSLAAAILLAAIFGVGYWWLVVRWKPPPSIFDDPVDDVLGYLAIDDFSQMPLEDRMAFLLEFSDRFRGMEQTDSAAMAAFLAGVSGPAREQMTQNARVLAKDILVDGAETYMNLPESERAAFMDEWTVKWMRMGGRLTDGEEDERTDEEMLTDMREDAREGEQDRDDRRSGFPTLTQTNAAGFLGFWQSEVEVAASPKEQGQILRFMVDLRKHFAQ